MANPVGESSFVTNFFSPSNLHLGVVHSINNIGGYQEFSTIAERNAIPTTPNSASAQPYNGFTLNDDLWSSGRRRVGMLVYVMENQKLYTLQPVGYFGNGGSLAESDWNSAPEWERAVRIDPTGAFSSEANSPSNNFNNPLVTSDASDLGIHVNAENVALTTLELANSCWVELELGIDGNPITNVQYGVPSAGDLTITLTHDGSGSGTPTIANGGVFTVNIPTGYDGIYDPVVADATVVPTDVGGIDSGTTAGDLSGLSMNQMWDKLLFPTVNPTGSGANTYINDVPNYTYKVVGETVSFTLESTASQGTLSNPAGPWAGPINAALIEDISAAGAATGPFNPTVTPPIGIADVPMNGYIVALGINRWRLTTSFDQGVMPVDSTGADFSNARFNAQDKTNTTDFEGVYPIKLGASTGNGNFVDRGLVSHGANNIECSQDYLEVDGGVRHRIAISDEMIAGRSVMIQQWSPTALAYVDLTMSSEWTQSSQSFNVEGNSINYTVFTKSSLPGGGDVGNDELYRIKF